MPQVKLNEEVELKTFTDDDAQALFSLVDKNRAMLREWLPWLDFNKTQSDSLTFIKFCNNIEITNKSITFGIWYKCQLAGVVGLHPIDWKNKKVAIGYWVGAEFNSHGLAKKATRYLTGYAFNDLKLNRVEILCATLNVKSQSVPKYLGFKLEGTLRDNEWLYDHYVDHFVYSMIQSEWKT